VVKSFLFFSVDILKSSLCKQQMTHLTMKADDDDGLLVFNSWDPFFYLSFPAKMKGGLGLIAVKKKKL
jgi:hypothetical protein